MDENLDSQQIVPQQKGEISSVSEMERRVATSVVRAIRFGMVLNQQGVTVNGKPFFEGNFEGLLDLTEGQPFWHPEVGIIGPGTIFTSVRDSWHKLDHYPWNWDPEHQYRGLPRIEGKGDETTKKRVIWVMRNSDGSSDFNDRVLQSGRGSVSIHEAGEIRYNEGGTERSLTDSELAEVESIFNDAYQKLQERKNLAKGPKKTKPPRRLLGI